MNCFKNLSIAIDIMSDHIIMQLYLEERSSCQQLLTSFSFFPPFWKLDFITVLWHAITPGWFYHNFGAFTFSHLLNSPPKPIVDCWVPQNYLNGFRLINKNQTFVCISVFVAFAIHIDTWSFSWSCNMLLCELVLVKDLRLFDTLLVNKGNFNSTRVISTYFSFGLLSFNNSFWCGEAKLFKPKLSVN